MSLFNSQQRSPFTVKGQVSGFFREPDGKVKYLQVAVEDREIKVKLSKDLRVIHDRNLVPGDWIQIWGESKPKRLGSEPKLKAYHVNKLSEPAGLPVTDTQSKPSCKGKAKILVCQKSSCLKRGGKKICQELETALGDRGLQNNVEIQRTGCLKRCSKGPSLVVMPEKTFCEKMRPNEVVEMLVKRLIPH